MVWSEKILNLFKALTIEVVLPKDVVVLNPYLDHDILTLCEQFYQSYYQDDLPRTFIVGINPGRHGGGITGIPFTDPHKLQEYCGIDNDLKKKSELSADFIYKVIMDMGGPQDFYNKFYISSISPLGFTMHNKNLNYYDLPKLQLALKPFIVNCLKKQMSFGLRREICFVLGEGKNYAYLKGLNIELNLFEKIVPLPHPRFIMQYKRKKLSEYIALYREALQTI